MKLRSVNLFPNDMLFKKIKSEREKTVTLESINNSENKKRFNILRILKVPSQGYASLEAQTPQLDNTYIFIVVLLMKYAKLRV